MRLLLRRSKIPDNRFWMMSRMFHRFLISSHPFKPAAADAR
jgi:hypothetical protein